MCGGFPCQDISAAGTQAGITQETRSGLWFEYARIIREVRPRFVIVENVRQLLSGHWQCVFKDLANTGYDAEWRIIRASDCGANHTRQRIFILAYTNPQHGPKGLGVIGKRPVTLLADNQGLRVPFWLQTADKFVGMDDGISGGAYRNRCEALGNALLPQIAEWIGGRILDREMGLR